MGRLLVTLNGEDDELAFVRRSLLVPRRRLALLRAHFGEDVLVARGGECFAVAHVFELAESSRRLRFEINRVRELPRPVLVPFGTPAPLGEVEDEAFAHILGQGFGGTPAFAEDHRILAGTPAKSEADIAVIAAYDLRCALTRYRATTAAEALGRFEVVHLRPVHEGGAESTANSIPVDAAVAYALHRGHIVITDDYRIAVRKALPAAPPHPLRRRLALPARTQDRPDPAALRFHRERFERT